MKLKQATPTLIVSESPDYLNRHEVSVLRAAFDMPPGRVLGRMQTGAGDPFYRQSPHTHGWDFGIAVAVLLFHVDAGRDPADLAAGHWGKLRTTILTGHNGIRRGRRNAEFLPQLILNRAALSFDPSVDTEAKRQRKLDELEATGVTFE